METEDNFKLWFWLSLYT